MKYHSSLSILYDALYCCTLYFNNACDITGICDIPAETAFPKLLMPFFYRRDDASAPAVLLYLKNKIFDINSISDFAESLQEDENSDLLRAAVLYTLFHSTDMPPHDFSNIPITDGCCSMAAAQMLDSAGYPAEFKYHALLCLTYYRHAVMELCRTLTALEPYISALHKKREGEVLSAFSAVISGKNDKLYKSAADLKLTVFEDVSVIISVLNPEVFLPYTEGLCNSHDNMSAGGSSQMAPSGRLVLIAGINHAEYLVRSLDEENIDLGSFMENIGNELRRMIIETLAENSEMTSSELSRRTGIPATTVLRHVEALCSDFIIKESGRRGMQVFYTLNREYIEKARRKTDRYLKALTEEGGL